MFPGMHMAVTVSTIRAAFGYHVVAAIPISLKIFTRSDFDFFSFRSYFRLGPRRSGGRIRIGRHHFRTPAFVQSPLHSLQQNRYS